MVLQIIFKALNSIRKNQPEYLWGGWNTPSEKTSEYADYLQLPIKKYKTFKKSLNLENQERNF